MIVPQVYAGCGTLGTSCTLDLFCNYSVSCVWTTLYLALYLWMPFSPQSWHNAGIAWYMNRDLAKHSTFIECVLHSCLLAISVYVVQRLEFQISLEIMPKFRLRSKLFSHSCVDLSNGRNGQSTTAKAAKSGSKWYTSSSNSKEPDVVHWKSKVWCC